MCTLLLGPSRSTSCAASAAASAVALAGSVATLTVCWSAPLGGAVCGGSGAGARCPNRLSQSCRRRDTGASSRVDRRNGFTSLVIQQQPRLFDKDISRDVNVAQWQVCTAEAGMLLACPGGECSAMTVSLLSSSAACERPALSGPCRRAETGML